MSFDKSALLFPVKNEMTFLSHCSISPFFSQAAERAIELIREQQYKGFTTFKDYYPQELQRLKEQTAALLRTRPENIAAVKNGRNRAALDIARGIEAGGTDAAEKVEDGRFSRSLRPS